MPSRDTCPILRPAKARYDTPNRTGNHRNRGWLVMTVTGESWVSWLPPAVKWRLAPPESVFILPYPRLQGQLTAKLLSNESYLPPSIQLISSDARITVQGCSLRIALTTRASLSSASKS